MEETPFNFDELLSYFEKAVVVQDINTCTKGDNIYQ